MRRLLLVLFVLPACVPATQPKPPSPEYTRALAAMCDVDHLAGLSAETNPFELARKRTEWVAHNAAEPDAIELRVYMSMKAPEEQATMLRDEAKSAGLRTCALADALAESKLGGFSQ